MKRNQIIWIGVIFLVLVVARAAFAQADGYTLPWWTSDGGGGDSRGGRYTLSGTIGQPDAGTLSGSGYWLEGGFWSGVGGAAQVQRVYLPLTARP